MAQGPSWTEVWSPIMVRQDLAVTGQRSRAVTNTAGHQTGEHGKALWKKRDAIWNSPFRAEKKQNGSRRIRNG